MAALSSGSSRYTKAGGASSPGAGGGEEGKRRGRWECGSVAPDPWPHHPQYPPSPRPPHPLSPLLVVFTWLVV